MPDSTVAPATPGTIVSPPSENELRTRLEALQASMARESLDAYIVVDPDNVFYLTNFFNFVHERPFVLVVRSQGCPAFVVPTLEVPHVQVRAVGPLELVEYFEFPAPRGEQWSDRLRAVLAGVERVGIEPTCPVSVLGELVGTTASADLIDEMRAVKSPYEIGRIAHAGTIASAGLVELFQGAHPGVPAIILYADASRLMTARMLADMPRANMLASSFAAVVQPPSLSHDPHNFTDVLAVLEEGGPHVAVISCRVNGYGIELERTFFLNSVPEAAIRPYEAMMEARHLAFEKTKPGESMADVDRSVRDLFTKYGYGDNLLHRVGHGIGVTNHEGPFLAVGYHHEIKPNMVFAIEPAIYLPGIGGFRHSDTVLVTDQGNMRLTDAPTALDDLTLIRQPGH